MPPAKLQDPPTLFQFNYNNPLSTPQQTYSDHLDNSRSRRLSVQFRGKISPVARSALVSAPNPIFFVLIPLINM